MIYGSPDSGRTVKNSDPEFSKHMKFVLGDILHLKEHDVNGTKLYGPGDIEGHLGKDGQFYLIDFARLLPPAAPYTAKLV